MSSLSLFHALCGVVYALAALASSAGAVGAAGAVQPGAPQQGSFAAPVGSAVAELAVPDVARLLHEDELRGHWPLRYGAVQSLDLNIDRDGRWAPALGFSVWSLELVAPGAKSLGLQFSELELPAGAELRVRSLEGLVTVGPYAAEDVHPLGLLSPPPLEGQRVLVELRVPAGFERATRLRLSGAIYDYRGLFELERGLLTLSGSAAGGSPNCAVDASCPAGAPFEDLRRATVRTLDGGVLCSGALIRSMDSSAGALVLTADHCGAGVNTIFRFGFERPVCGSGPAPTDRNLSGALLVASDESSDGRLLRLTSPIPAAWSPFFAGWSRSQLPPQDAVHLHHPEGTPRSLALAPGGATPSTEQFVGLGAMEVWGVDFALGGAQPGSSGGPLFDGSDRLRGVLTGGPDSDCSERYFGRLDLFLEAQTAALAALDPFGTGIWALDGVEGPTPPGPLAPTIATLDPPMLPALDPSGTATLVVRGSGFSSLTSVSLGGVLLGSTAPAVIVVADDELRVQIEPQPATGLLALEVTTALGTAAAMLDVQPVPVPVHALHLEMGGYLTSSAGLTLDAAAALGSTVFVLASLAAEPTLLPGVLDVQLGAGGTALVLLGSHVTPQAGWSRTEFSLAGLGLPPGTRVYTQSAATGLGAQALPLVSSPRIDATLLF